MSDSGSKSQKGKECTMKKMDGKFKNFIYYFFYFIISIADIIAFFIINIFKI